MAVNIGRAADAPGPRRHQHDVVGENDRLLHVVGDEQDRHAAERVNAQGLAMHRGAGLRIQP